jgi:HNH endonuclease
MIEIQLTKGQVAIVDDCDADLAAVNWSCSNGYAKRSIGARGNEIQLSMHRVILERIIGRELSTDEVPDHIDRNKSNNSRSNLRVATRQKNSMNRAKQSGCNLTSQYKGVSKHPAAGCEWRAMLYVSRKPILIGYFKTELEAAIAYNHVAVVQHGEFASLNDIPDWQIENPIPSFPEINKLGSSGYKYVVADRGKWAANPTLNGKRKNLGYFNDPADAYQAVVDFLTLHGKLDQLGARQS